MTKQLQVSVIVPVRNGAEYIGRCIRSLLNQSMEQEKYEIIVINDASTDKTKLAIKTFLGDVVYLENKKRKGCNGDNKKKKSNEVHSSMSRLPVVGALRILSIWLSYLVAQHFYRVPLGT